MCLYTVYTYIWHMIWHATFFNFIQLIATPSSSPFSTEIPGPASDEDGSWSLSLLKSWMARWLDGFYFKRSQLSNKSWFILWWKIHDELIVEDNLGEPLCWVISSCGALISRYLTHIVARVEIMFNAGMGFVDPFQRNLEIYCPRVASGLPVIVWYCLIGRFHILQTLATWSA